VDIRVASAARGKLHIKPGE